MMQLVQDLSKDTVDHLYWKWATGCCFEPCVKLLHPALATNSLKNASKFFVDIAVYLCMKVYNS